MLELKTITNGTAIYKGTPFLTCSSNLTAASLFSASAVHTSAGILLIASVGSPTVEGNPIVKPAIANKIIPDSRTSADHTPWCLILLITSTLWIPELTIVVSEIKSYIISKNKPLLL